MIFVELWWKATLLLYYHTKSNSESSSEELELNTWFWETLNRQTRAEDLTKGLSDFTGRGKRCDVWKDTQAEFETLGLMNETFEQEKIVIC